MGTHCVFPETVPSLGLSLLSCSWFPQRGDPHQSPALLCCACSASQPRICIVGAKLQGHVFGNRGQSLGGRLCFQTLFPQYLPQHWGHGAGSGSKPRNSCTVLRLLLLAELTPLSSFLLGFSRISFINCNYIYYSIIIYIYNYICIIYKNYNL